MANGVDVFSEKRRQAREITDEEHTKYKSQLGKLIALHNRVSVSKNPGGETNGRYTYEPPLLSSAQSELLDFFKNWLVDKVNLDDNEGLFLQNILVVMKAAGYADKDDRTSKNFKRYYR